MNPREYRAMFEVEDHHWWYVAVQREVEKCLERFGEKRSPGAFRLLDAGCGTGGLLAYLSRSHGRRCFGLEVSSDGVWLARSRGLPGLVQGSAAELPFGSRSFDAVTSVDVLCHAGVDERRALTEFYRVLKPGGILILQLPAFEWLRSEHDAAVWTKRRYSKGEVEGLLREAGLTLQACSYRNALLFPLAVLPRVLKRGRREAREEALSDVRRVPRLLNTILERILDFESRLSARGLRFPVGLSVLCVGRKEGKKGSAGGELVGYDRASGEGPGARPGQAGAFGGERDDSRVGAGPGRQ